MEKEFVPYELAVKLKELGFDEPCLGFYNHQGQLILMAQEDESSIETYKNSYVEMGMQYAAPLYQQAFRWFREKYFIHGEPKYKGGLTKETAWYDYIIISNIDWDDSKIKNKQYKTYEEAELACLEKLIEIAELK